MKTLTLAKRQVTKDWLTQFTGLGQYEPLQLLRRVGPILEGIVLNRTSGNDVYEPTFHVHCLARESSFVTMTLDHRLRSERTGGPDWVTVRQHESKYVEAADRLRRQNPLKLE